MQSPAKPVFISSLVKIEPLRAHGKVRGADIGLQTGRVNKRKADFGPPMPLRDGQVGTALLEPRMPCFSPDPDLPTGTVPVCRHGPQYTTLASIARSARPPPEQGRLKIKVPVATGAIEMSDRQIHLQIDAVVRLTAGNKRAAGIAQRRQARAEPIEAGSGLQPDFNIALAVDKRRSVTGDRAYQRLPPPRPPTSRTHGVGTAALPRRKPSATQRVKVPDGGLAATGPHRRERRAKPQISRIRVKVQRRPGDLICLGGTAIMKQASCPIEKPGRRHGGQHHQNLPRGTGPGGIGPGRTGPGSAGLRRRIRFLRP